MWACLTLFVFLRLGGKKNIYWSVSPPPPTGFRVRQRGWKMKKKHVFGCYNRWTAETRISPVSITNEIFFYPPLFCFLNSTFESVHFKCRVQHESLNNAPSIGACAAEEPDVKLINSRKFNSKKFKAVSCWWILGRLAVKWARRARSPKVEKESKLELIHLMWTKYRHFY